jgi:hypothetical protein
MYHGKGTKALNQDVSPVRAKLKADRADRRRDDGNAGVGDIRVFDGWKGR